MEIKTLEQWQAADERTLHFTPWGLGRMPTEDSAESQQRVIARLELADGVAESTRNKFEQLRAGFSHEVLCYELFTLVEDASPAAADRRRCAFDHGVKHSRDPFRVEDFSAGVWAIVHPDNSAGKPSLLGGAHRRAPSESHPPSVRSSSVYLHTALSTSK
ncbi:hypothetical protein [Streptomyces sp. NPDC052092]|uniref:hypothetical protein n=1 Tax=Streptomyces sp. NPDC052092 TaxID=3365685 RepID=UPI0037D92D8F